MSKTGRNSALSAIGRWRDWSIPVKLIAVMLVPVITTLALGIVVINAQMAKADVYISADGLTQLSDNARSAISALQQERQQVAADSAAQGVSTAAASMPASSMSGSTMKGQPTKVQQTPPPAPTPKPDPSMAGIQHEVDLALAGLRQTEATNAGRAGFDPVAAAAWDEATRQLGELSALRAGEGSQDANASTEVDSYTQLIDGIFAFDRVLATDLGDPQLTREAMALYDLFSAREEVLYQQSVVLVGIGRGTMTVAEVTSLHGSEARLASRISDFRAVAAADAATDYQKAVSGTTLSQQGALLDQAIEESGGMSGQIMPGMVIRIPLDTWNSANQAVSGGLTSVTDTLAGQLRTTAASMQSTASNTAGTAAVILFAALLVAALIMVIIARQLLRSVGVLRRSARDVATRHLPEAVERIQAGETVDIAVTPVPVHTSDEVGQLARAFDAVHAEALKLAVEQANLRGNYSDLFTNLSRRSQGLVQRQLRLIEQLERDEEDPDQLAALFKLDHLATRMRRNNENLMVLSGGELGRGPGQAMPLSDLLRAAVSEIEQYQRVSVQPPPGAHILGYAAGDLVRLVAELLDNATAFSAPDTQVTIASHRTRSRSIVVDIVDHGIGMGDEELRTANERLGEAEGFEGRITRRMGLFVVSKLASQHGVRVRLHGGEDIPGLRVTVTLPAQLIVGDEDTQLSLPPGELETPRPRPESSMDAITVTIPQLPSAVASGVNLFAPLPGSATAADAAEEAESEQDGAGATTPIFDDMLSAWFDSAKPMDAASEAEAPPEDASFAGRTGWRFAADEGWKAADSVTQSAPEAFTSAGLPKRQPKARLLPGSAGATGTTGVQPAVGPGAEKMRRRLAGFQRGVQKGRHQISEVGLTEPEWPTEGADSALFTEPAGEAEVEIAVEAIGESTVEDASASVSSENSAAVVNADSLEDTAIWPAAADEGWEAVPEGVGGDAESLDPAPAAFTPAGLPRRQPRAQLVPGSVGGGVGGTSDGMAGGTAGSTSGGTVATKGKPAMAGADAGAVRDRLSSFQRGVRQGRDGSAATDGIEHGFEWEND